jgi:nucleoside-diphosphate-sugar epimerase
MMPRRVLVTGGSGYVATLIAASLIEWTECLVIAAVRSPKSLFNLEDRVKREVSATRQADVAHRFRAVCLPGTREHQLASCLREHRVTQIVHCAGSVDYSDLAALYAANVELTRVWLAASRSSGISRFVHISTAFSAGCGDREPIGENLHPHPSKEATVYTRTKRESERLVAESGIPFVIVRPSILMGDSSDGHYAGKAYGVYQFWKSAERLLSDRWRPHIHVVAPQQPVPLIHQDHFMRVFCACFDHARADSIINVVSENDSLPTCRDIWNLFAAQCLMPEAVTFYDSIEQVELSRIDRRNRAFLKSISTNVAITSLRWRFETPHLHRFAKLGYERPQATLESLLTCQGAFVATSRVLEKFRRTHLSRHRPEAPRLLNPVGK